MAYMARQVGGGFTDGAKLFAQKMFALRTAHLVVSLRLNFGLNGGDFQFSPQLRIDPTQARERIHDLKDLLRFSQS